MGKYLLLFDSDVYGCLAISVKRSQKLLTDRFDLPSLMSFLIILSIPLVSGDSFVLAVDGKIYTLDRRLKIEWLL